MRVRGKGVVIHGAEGATPPLPYIELDDSEALALIARGVAVAVDELAAAPELSVAPEPVIVPAAEVAPVQEPEPQTEPEVVQEPAEKPQAATPRLEEIAEAIELLDDDDFVKTGARAGKPKVAPLASVLGYEVTADEVDAAFALKDAGQE
jgi:hypothetical protein